MIKRNKATVKTTPCFMAGMALLQLLFLKYKFDFVGIQQLTAYSPAEPAACCALPAPDFFNTICSACFVIIWL